MEKLKTEIANAIMLEMQEKNPSCCNFSYKLIASSSLDPSWNINQTDLLNNTKNFEGETVWINNYANYIRSLFRAINVKEKFNVIDFLFENKLLTEVKTYWEQSVQDEFEQYLPKSKKGKIKAWYLPTDDTQTEIKKDMQLPKKDV